VLLLGEGSAGGFCAVGARVARLIHPCGALLPLALVVLLFLV
jgi:hypothetical protein